MFESMCLCFNFIFPTIFFIEIMAKRHRIIKLLFFLFLATGMFSCVQQKSVFIVIGENASTTEILTANHLKRDLELTSGKTVNIIDSKNAIPENGLIYVVGTPGSNSVIAGLINTNVLVLTENFPGKRGGIWSKVNLTDGNEAIILAGSDVQGAQYAVYEYSHKVLGIDPLEYWTGKLPGPGKHFDPYNF